MSMLALVGGVTIALLLWQMARLKVQPHVAPSAAQVAEPIVPAAAPQVVVLPEPERAEIRLGHPSSTFNSGGGNWTFRR